VQMYAKPAKDQDNSRILDVDSTSGTVSGLKMDTKSKESPGTSTAEVEDFASVTNHHETGD